MGRSKIIFYNYIYMKISLVIPAYNEEKYIKGCLESVQKNGNGLFEVIVVSNASTDATAEIAHSFSFVRVVDEAQKGLPIARQRGFDESKGDIVAFIDADARIPSGWFEKIKSRFEKDPHLVCLSGPYVYYDSSQLSKILVWIYWIFLGFPTYWFTGYMAIAGNLAVRRDAFVKIGGFDMNITFYGDDTDISRRLHAIGHTTFAYDFIMFSSARRLKGEGIFKTAFRYIINYISIVVRHKPATNNEYKDIR